MASASTIARRKRIAKGLSPDDARHGTHNGYTNWGCRCTACREAANSAARGRVRIRTATPLDENSSAHGTRTGYGIHKCRCNLCRTARRDYDIRRNYGLTPSEYLALLERQGGCCALCKSLPEEGKYLAVDHDRSCCPTHRTCGQCVRGLLCSSCNTGLGHLKDDVTILRAAIEYLA